MNSLKFARKIQKKKIFLEKLIEKNIQKNDILNFLDKLEFGEQEKLKNKIIEKL